MEGFPRFGAITRFHPFKHLLYDSDDRFFTCFDGFLCRSDVGEKAQNGKKQDGVGNFFHWSITNNLKMTILCDLRVKSLEVTPPRLQMAHQPPPKVQFYCLRGHKSSQIFRIHIPQSCLRPALLLYAIPPTMPPNFQPDN